MTCSHCNKCSLGSMIEEIIHFQLQQKHFGGFTCDPDTGGKGICDAAQAQNRAVDRVM